MWADGRTDMTKLTVALRNTANAPNKMQRGGVKAVYSVTCRQFDRWPRRHKKKNKLQRAWQVGKSMFPKFKYSKVASNKWNQFMIVTGTSYENVTSTKALSPRLLKDTNVAHGFRLHSATTVPHPQFSWTTIILQLKSLWKNTMGQSNVFPQLSIYI